MALMGLLPFCIIFISLHYSKAHAAISRGNYMQLEEQLKILNKPPSKTIKEGDIIDCIDYKQPTLDHPLLKNHTIRMRPSFLPRRVLTKTKGRAKSQNTIARRKFVNCPTGTIPIRRTGKEDLIRAESFIEKYSTAIHPLTYFSPGKHQSILRTVPNPNTTYKGVEAFLNVYNPSVRAGQSSSSQMWIENGAPDVRNSLQVGWMVAPDLYSDNRTHEFVYWSKEGKTREGCFNYLCQGFIQVAKNYAMGSPIDDVSTYGDVQSDIPYGIRQDPKSGDWWLISQYSQDDDFFVIGYWPKDLFPLLADGASQVAWGGQTLASSDGATPEMGSGHFPDGNYRHGCYFSEMYVVDETNQVVEPEVPRYQMESFVDNKNCYNLEGWGHVYEKIEGFSFLFGGPGGTNCGI
ncbi:hypothetical protein ACHQM5_000276 [Ranunculus cassubicifolius]